MKRIVTKHGKKRIKERVGVRNTRYNYKQARIEGNYNYQYDGDFRKFLDYLAHKNKHCFYYSFSRNFVKNELGGRYFCR